LPQETHIKIGQSAKRSYVGCRLRDDVDLASIMTTVVDDLVLDWKEYDAEAFVNAWDIGNYVSDYLAKRAGVEGCSCSTDIVEVDE